ncbi:type II toxin-antitoxin system RelE/ParE family toxin [Desulfonatronum thioautotrophicum]|uniref:type II toxin-antitoxin system RelE/ParE family toxin n=1 Tax=Desulfonatronum thioautotrophicum TaxID=617001 RepID=UPI0009FD9A70|nr:type II toxin-antitoxin system RelE/ParE family toxin [Desulfonatronum thioautotrophicum]
MNELPEKVFSTVTVKGSQMALLHVFIKKSQKTPLKEMTLARTRMKQWLEGGIGA